MAATHSEILYSLLDYLNYRDDHFGSLLKLNRARIVETDARVAESFAQIASRED